VAKLTFKGGDQLERVLQVKRTLITGRVTRVDTGEPLAGIGQGGLQAYPIEVDEDGQFKRRLGHAAYATPNEDGRYEFPGLAPGHYRIWCHPRDKSLKPVKRVVDFTGGGTLTVDFLLETRTTGTLRLEVRQPDGTAATGLNFSLILERQEKEDGRVSTWSSSLLAKGAGNGVYEFELEAGEREVRVWGPGYHTETLIVSIPEGGTTTRAVELRVVEKEEKEEAK
jgi:hypothetical protein